MCDLLLSKAVDNIGSQPVWQWRLSETIKAVWISCLFQHRRIQDSLGFRKHFLPQETTNSKSIFHNSWKETMTHTNTIPFSANNEHYSSWSWSLNFFFMVILLKLDFPYYSLNCSFFPYLKELIKITYMTYIIEFHKERSICSY